MVILGSEYNLGHILAYTVAYIEERSCAIEEYILTFTTPIKTQVLGHPQTGNWCVGSEGVIGQGGIWKSAKNYSLSIRCNYYK